MKKSMPLIGFIATVLSITGMIFKIMHWPGASISIVLGLGLFAISFLPAFGYKLFYDLNGIKSKFAGICGSILFISVALGALFKIQHWAGAGLMLVIPFGVLALAILPTLLFFKIKASATGKEKYLHLTWYLSLSLLSLGYLFKTMHWPGAGPLLLFGTGTVCMGYLPLALKLYNNDENRNKLYSRFVIIPAVLIFVLMTATSVNKSVLNSFVTIDDGIRQSGTYQSLNNENFYGKFQIAKFQNENNPESQKQYLEAMKVKELSNDLCEHIEKLKIHLMKSADGITDEVPDSLINPAALNNKDSYDIPTRILIGDPDNPNMGAWSAIELKAKLFAFRQNIISMFDKGGNAFIDKRIGLKTENIYSTEEERDVAWEYDMFYHIPTVAVITKLSILQNDVRFSESVVLRLVNKFQDVN